MYFKPKRGVKRRKGKDANDIFAAGKKPEKGEIDTDHSRYIIHKNISPLAILLLVL